MRPGFIEDITDLTLQSSDLRLSKLMESEEWEDIKNIITVLYSWTVEELVEDKEDEILKTQGRCFVLREIGQQIERYVKEITDVNIAREVDDDYEELLTDEEEE